MKWTINYYNQSVKEEASLLPKSIKAKFVAIMDKMSEYGLGQLDLALKRMKEVKTHDI